MKRLSELEFTSHEKDGPAATPQEIESWLQELPHWEVVYRENVPQLVRTFEFDDFAPALGFTNRVGQIAEERNHHPAILTEWGKVTVTLWTHSVGGLHQNDFVMAAETDELYEEQA